MHRGILTLSQEEVDKLVNSITSARLTSPLTRRIVAAQLQKVEITKLQVNENELETMLDDLGSPNEDDEDRKFLRLSIQKYLAEIRHGQEEADKLFEENEKEEQSGLLNKFRKVFS